MSLKNELREAAEGVERAEGLWAQYKSEILLISGASAAIGFVLGLLV